MRGVRIVRRSFYNVFPKWPPPNATTIGDLGRTLRTLRTAATALLPLPSRRQSPAPPIASPLITEPTENGMSIYQDMAFNRPRCAGCRRPSPPSHRVTPLRTQALSPLPSHHLSSPPSRLSCSQSLLDKKRANRKSDVYLTRHTIELPDIPEQ